jgi:hypothetical protein
MSENAAPAAAPAAPAGDASDHDQPQGGEQPQGKEQAASKQKAPNFRKFKDGDEEFALSDEEIVRERKKWKGADAKFREAAEARKSVEQFMKALEEDPESVLSDPRLPIDRKKLAEKWLTQQIEAELNPPDPRDKKLTEAERKLKEYEEKEAAAKKAEEDQKVSAARQKSMQTIGETLREAGRLSHLSAHPESEAGLIREMAMYMRAAKERGEDVTPQQLVEHIHNTRFHQLYTLAHQFEGNDLIEFLGEEIVTRIRKADLARLRAGRDRGETHRQEVSQESPRSSRNAPRMDAIEARKHAAKIMGGR